MSLLPLLSERSGRGVRKRLFVTSLRVLFGYVGLVHSAPFPRFGSLCSPVFRLGTVRRLALCLRQDALPPCRFAITRGVKEDVKEIVRRRQGNRSRSRGRSVSKMAQGLLISSSVSRLLFHRPLRYSVFRAPVVLGRVFACSRDTRTRTAAAEKNDTFQSNQSAMISNQSK